MSKRMDMVVGMESSVPPFCLYKSRPAVHTEEYCVLEPDAGGIKCQRQKLFDDFDGGVEDPHPIAIAVIFV